MAEKEQLLKQMVDLYKVAHEPPEGSFTIEELMQRTHALRDELIAFMDQQVLLGNVYKVTIYGNNYYYKEN